VGADQLHHAPFAERDPYTTLVHATRASDVRLTMVDGHVLHQRGRLTLLDPERCAAEAAREGAALLQRAGIAGPSA